MQGLKPVFGLIGSILPVLYFGGLFYYFYDVAGSVEQAKEMGLAPTLLGLAIVGLLLSIPLLIKLVAIFVALVSPGSRGRNDPDPSAPDDSGFDADAAIARYKAQRSAEAAAAARGGPASGPSKGFGRRTR